ncbi:hypothetical protein GN956_G8141 [Arapaima gigas]
MSCEHTNLSLSPPANLPFQMVVKNFMDMDQDSEEEKEQYLNLACHLASDFFLTHPDKEVRLLVACCLTDIFRIYVPEASCAPLDKLKDIFMFITQQLKGLEDTKSTWFNQYFYLLENISLMKSYRICFELKDSDKIFIQLYRTLFQVINNGHNQKVHMHMVDLMSSIIFESDTISQELLDTVLVNLVPAQKKMNKQAYNLAKALLKRTAQAIEPCITNFFNQVLMLDKKSLEFKLKSSDNNERLQVVKLLSNMFGAKNSELALQNKHLWQCFIGRFNDIHVLIRLECVKFASQCLENHPDLSKDLTEPLKFRSHDPEEVIRYDVIASIVTIAKKDLALINNDLLNLVRERTLDKRWRVRKEAMMGLALIYKKYFLQQVAGVEATKQISWIKNKLLHIYYQNSIVDRLLVEHIFARYMVPQNLETYQRMKCFYYLYATLDPNAVKAFHEMWKCQNLLRHHVKGLLGLVSQPKRENCSQAVFSKVMLITRNLPDPGKAPEFAKKLTQFLEENSSIREQLETLVDPTCCCKQAELCVRDIKKKLHNLKQLNNPFVEMMNSLLERIAPVLVDTESISALIKQVNKSIEGTADDEVEGVPTDQAIRAGVDLLKVLSFSYPVSFHSAEAFEFLLGCLKIDDEKVVEGTLQIFRNTGSRIEESFPHIKSILLPVLLLKANKGPPQQAKYAIHCIHAMFSSRDMQFARIFVSLQKSLDLANAEQLITSLTTLGHLAFLVPQQFAGPLESLVANFIVKDLLMSDRTCRKKTTELWVSEEEVSAETLAKIQGIKLMVKWLLGVKNNQSKSARSTLKMLMAVLSSNGDLTKQGKMGPADMSRMRLAAGCALLKLAQEPCYHDIITLEQYQRCALLINDKCYQVRQIFSEKLHRSLCQLRLPMEYLAAFALCARDPVKERRAHARQCLLKNISVRCDYLKQHTTVGEKLFFLLPEYVVAYIIYLLVHDPDYTTVQDIKQLKNIKECLWFVLEILMAKNENNSHAFIHKMVQTIKQSKDGQVPDDTKMNEKLYTVCDLAMDIIRSRSNTYNLELPKDPVLPSRFFTQPDKDFINKKIYLPPEMKSIFSTGKIMHQSKFGTVPGTVNNPFPANSSHMETLSNSSINSIPKSLGQHKARDPAGGGARTQSSDVDQGKNEDVTIMRASLFGKKDKGDDSSMLWESDKPPHEFKRRAATSPGSNSKPKRGYRKANTYPKVDEEIEEEMNGDCELKPKTRRRARIPWRSQQKNGNHSRETGKKKHKCGEEMESSPPKNDEKLEENQLKGNFTPRIQRKSSRKKPR